MAFFGLTALGPQDTFAKHSVSFVNIQVFDDAHFDSAWTAVLPREDRLKTSNLNLVLNKLFRGPAPKSDSDLIHGEFLSDEISYEEYMRGMRMLANDVQQNKKESLKRKHLESVRLQDKILAPLTTVQEYGWEHQELQKPIAGRASSQETKYASELVKAGIFY